MSLADSTTGEVLTDAEVIEELDADAARALTDRIVHSVTFAAELVAEAWQGRAWKSLGYRSWEDYADAELPTLGTNSANRHVLLVGLRNVGMSTRAIGAATGLHHSTVARGVANATPDEVTGTDGKQYPSKIRRTETVEFDSGEAAVGDDAGGVPSDASPDPVTVPTSPESPTDVEPPPAPSAPAERPPQVNSSATDPVEDDGTARPEPSTGSLIDLTPAPAAHPVRDAVDQLGRFVAILAGMDEPVAQQVYEQGIWEFALGFIADHPDELDLSDVAVAALRTRSIDFPRGMQ